MTKEQKVEKLIKAILKLELDEGITISQVSERDNNIEIICKNEQLKAHLKFCLYDLFLTVDMGTSQILEMINRTFKN